MEYARLRLVWLDCVVASRRAGGAGVCADTRPPHMTSACMANEQSSVHVCAAAAPITRLLLLWAGRCMGQRACGCAGSGSLGWAAFTYQGHHVCWAGRCITRSRGTHVHACGAVWAALVSCLVRLWSLIFDRQASRRLTSTYKAGMRQPVPRGAGGLVHLSCGPSSLVKGF